LLVRLDSAHDAVATLATLLEKGVDFIVKWNPRKTDVPIKATEMFYHGKTVHQDNNCRFVRATERYVDRHGQRLLVPDMEIEGWWANLTVAKDKVIELDKGHALCEQYHSELKTDLDLEWLPSGKFATEALVMSCAGLAYNLLRAIGQVGLMDKKQARRTKQWQRLKTVRQNLMYFAARMIRHGHGLTIRFSCHATWQAHAYFKTYEYFAYG